jgi:hypothetical protein
LVAVKEVKEDKDDIEPADDFTFFYGKRDCKSSLRNRLFRSQENQPKLNLHDITPKFRTIIIYVILNI